MRRSLESSRPILPQKDPNKRASTRFSIYSSASSAYTEKSHGPMPSGSESPISRDMAKYSSSVDRMESKRLQDQRYIPSSEKDDVMSKLALGAKVQKALDRRYSSQDYVPKPKSSKPPSTKSAQSASHKR